jgi:hypothetical protein
MENTSSNVFTDNVILLQFFRTMPPTPDYSKPKSWFKLISKQIKIIFNG